MKSQTTTFDVFEGHGVTVAVWTCTPGGWEIVDRPNTEAMLLLEGATTNEIQGELADRGERALASLEHGLGAYAVR